MQACFFGHRDAAEGMEALLMDTVCRLIEERSVTAFFVGGQGAFDRLVQRVLISVKKRYPCIQTTVVLAYLPGTVGSEIAAEGLSTVYPEGLERVPKRFAINRRNIWMIDRCEIVVTYVRSPVGGASKAKERAVRKRKSVIELAGLM